MNESFIAYTVCLLTSTRGFNYVFVAMLANYKGSFSFVQASLNCEHSKFMFNGTASSIVHC
jgi:hypothetical protein